VVTAVSGILVAFRMRETMVLIAGRIEPSEL
jgi:hypothetical protein